MQITLHQVAEQIGARLKGDGDTEVSALCSIDEILPGSLVFAKGDSNLSKAESSEAVAILTDQHYEQSSKHLLQVENPFAAFIELIHYFYPPRKPSSGIHPTAVIGDDVILGREVSIGPQVSIGRGSVIGDGTVIKSHVSIGEEVSIGAHCVLHPNVVIYDDCVLKDFVIIHASSVIGSDGFGYHFADGMQRKVPHAGTVLIENHVEIGANTTIDRATLGATVIGEGTKIDNQVQIAHSVKLGKHNILCAFTGIAGSTTSGNYVVFAANVGVSDHVRIDDGVILGARTGVPPNKHLRGNQVYLGSPSRPKDKAIELELGVNRLPGMRKRIARLDEQLKELTKQVAQEKGK